MSLSNQHSSQDFNLYVKSLMLIIKSKASDELILKLTKILPQASRRSLLNMEELTV